MIRENRGTLVFLHGWGSEPEIWHKQAAYFKDRHNVIMPGVYTFTDVPGSGKFILVGWSLGGMIALEVAHKNPQGVEGLVLISTTPRYIKSEDAPFGTHPGFVKRMQKRVKKDPKEALEWFRKLSAINSPMYKNLPELFLLCEWLDKLQKMDLRPLLPQIKTPCLIIHSDNDEVVSPSAAEYLNEHLPNAQLHILKEAGHAPFLTEAQKVNSLIEGFIREDKGDKGKGWIRGR